MDEKKIEEKVKLFEKDFNELLKKYGLEMTAQMVFPQYNILPPKLQLALQIVYEEGVQFKTFFKEVKK